MFSVIIPAHNEAAVIDRCLHALLDGASESEMEVLVVANGCTDATAAVAREFNGVRVIETELASKPNALNIGDRAANGFPRVYVDADVVLPMASLRRLVKRLAAGDVLAAAPQPSFDLRFCSWPVRAFYEINAKLPSSQEAIGGSGVYAVSAIGRRRFGEFPPIIADDTFVRIQFSPSERTMVRTSQSVVRAPQTFGELIAIKTRSHLGTRELRKRYPDLWRNKGADNWPALRLLFLKPWLWPALLMYGTVKLAARLRSAGAGAGAAGQWKRDDSSRRGLHEQPAGG